MTENEKAVAEVLSEYSAALNASKTEQVMPLYAEDGIFMAPYSQSSVGIAAVRKAYDTVFETRKFDVTFHPAEIVEMSPDWVYARTNSSGSTTNPKTGVKSSEGNQELFIFKKDSSGEFKIYRYSFSPVTPPKG